MIESDRAHIEKKSADTIRELKCKIGETEASLNRQINDLKAKLRASEEELSKS